MFTVVLAIAFAAVVAAVIFSLTRRSDNELRRISPDPSSDADKTSEAASAQRLAEQLTQRVYDRGAPGPLASPGDPMLRGYAPQRPAPSSQTLDDCWIPPGRSITIAGRDIPGGMLLVGNGLRSVSGAMLDPALIDPSLPVSRGSGAATGTGMPYWPSYTSIGPANRAAYLEWLASGRSDPNAYIGYVFLFLYGLERRVLDPSSACPPDDHQAILAEVTRLRSIYDGSQSFRNYAGAFLEHVLMPLTPGGPSGTPSNMGGSVGSESKNFRLALQACANQRTPVPAEVAYQWVVNSPTARLATAAQRCRTDFHRLFVVRYASRFGEGLKIKGRAGRSQVTYQPASAGFGGQVRITLPAERVPRVVSEEIPTRLQEFVDECAAALDPYSRWIGRNPGKERSISALALLPSELLDAERRVPAAPLLRVIESALSGSSMGIVPGGSLLKDWPMGADGKLGKADLVALAQFLEKFGYGIEPDVRFGSPKFDHGDSVVVFKLLEGATHSPSTEYSGATLLLHLAALVAMADGSVSIEEERHLLDHLDRSSTMNAAERLRLSAHFRWVAAAQPGFAGVRKRIASLNDSQRETLGEFLVSVAGVDGTIANAEIDILQKIYQTIGIPPTLVFSHIHALSTDSSGRDEPVTVVPAGKRSPGFDIPAMSEAKRESGTGVRLNAALVERKLQQSSAVAALLGSVFAEEPVATQESPQPAVPEAGTRIAGLDAAHSQLLRQLAAKSSWPRAEFESLAASVDLLPDGALDRLNETAYDVASAPLTDDGDPLTLDPSVLEELMK